MDWSLPARLLLAHVLGDFLLQPDSWVADRRARHFRSSRLYLHTLVHFILATALAFQPQAWRYGLLIASGHLLFDGLKAALKQEGILPFLIDQTLHFLVIGICWLCLTPGATATGALAYILNSPRLWWLCAGYALNVLLFPTLIALATAQWRKEIPEERELLYKAGRWIGIIERVLCFSFVLIGQWGAIGFLIAAKSVFRFGDLREGRDKGQTEYMLIGSLLSFGLAIMTGLGVQIVLKQLAA